MIVTPICEMLGIQYPVLQGGMAWVSDASLASAVSNSGGLGIVSAMSMNAEQLREEIRQTRVLTQRPFGVNIMLMSPYVDEVARCVIEEEVPVVTTGAGLPGKFMKAWLEAGIRVVPVVPSVAVAKLVERGGACAVIAEGGESGGHVGEITTMALVPQICDAVSIPVIAAGGIADGRGMAAAMMLGAVGVQMGTRFLVARECTIHQAYKDRVLRAKDIDTMTTGKRLGHPVRALKNLFTQEFLKKEYDSTISNEELERFGAGALRRAAREGNEKSGCFMAGQIAALVNREQTATEIIQQLLEETQQVLCGAMRWVR
ncbi:MAG: enoyl-[acyl-carrier-protein] reductase FabK [Clostridiales bacterium]|nr:enoyl-[acyl-carrier-protein] reductase FabK [Clostridiales bacterium]